MALIMPLSETYIYVNFQGFTWSPTEILKEMETKGENLKLWNKDLILKCESKDKIMNKKCFITYKIEIARKITQEQIENI